MRPRTRTVNSTGLAGRVSEDGMSRATVAGAQASQRSLTATRLRTPRWIRTTNSHHRHLLLSVWGSQLRSFANPSTFTRVA